ncbi:MAG: thioredoxin domain-containing protein [SAR202 cluster bacterium]|nr:thioredoxin domain-containing protein [SAR202 cluster bacterium]
MADGFLALYQFSGDEKWILLVGKFLDTILLHFDDSEEGFFDTADDAPPLVRRPQSISDNAEPAGWLAAANALLSYAAITGENNYRIRAEAALTKITPLIARAPRAIGWGLVAATALIDGPIQVAIIGPAGEETDELWHRAWKSTAPGAVIARTAPNVNPSVGLLKNRSMISNQPTAYVCRGFICELPTTDPTELTEILQK